MLFARDFLADQRVFRRPGAPERPSVSVVLPTYRRCAGGLLGRAVESVLSQSFQDLELIVVDDGSTDGSRDFLLARQAEDPRLVYVRHDVNCGLPALRVNEGIELARGRFLAFQFDDDEWLEGGLEGLVERARELAEPAVVFGQAELVPPEGGTRVLPGVDVNLLTLSYENRIANNSVLLPRELLELCGLYDCHVGMRRFCDWDLWIRLARRASFQAVDRRVSRANVAADAGSIGVSVPADHPLFRYLQAIPRDHLLRPASWRDYEVDGLRVGEVEVIKGFRERLEADHVRPFHRRLRHAFPYLADPPPPPAARPRSMLFTMDSYYGSFEMCMGHYDPLSYHRGFAKMHYQPLYQIGPNWGRDVDLVLLVRSVTEPGESLAADALAARIPAGFYLDDDFLHLYEYGPPFDILAPGMPRHQSLVTQLKRVDAVWVTRPVIAESVRPHNPRIVPHNGSVPEGWLPAELRPRPADGPIRIGYVGGGYRIGEFSALWDAFRRLSAEFGDRLAFGFWGLDVSALPPLDSPVEQRPFVHGYQEFIDRLREARFDILLTPLRDHPRPHLAKTPNKYYHAAVAGSLGIFSDVPQYALFPHGLTCLKTANDPDSWYAALREAVTMPAERFDRIRRRMVEHVRLEFTDGVQIHLHEAAVRATEFHSATRERRGEDGRPRVLYLPSGAPEAAADLRRAAAIARDYGIQTVEPRTGIPGDRQALRALLDRWSPALVHATEPAPVVREVCAEKGVPLVSSCPATRPLEVFEQRLREVLEAAADGTGAELLEARAAYRLDRAERHPQRGANELFILYNQALAAGAPAPPAAAPAPPAPAAALSRRDRLRGLTQTLGVYRPLSRLYWSHKRKRVLVTYDHYIASVFLYWEHALPRLQEATGRRWLLLPADQVKPEDLYSFHAVISVRGISKRSLEVLRAAKRSGCRTVYDTDDNLLLIDQGFSDPENPWRKIFGEARPEIEAMLGLADAVKVYGEAAVPSFRRHNPNVTAIRPYQILDGDAPPPREDRRPVTVGFLGSYFKDDEFAPVAPAILRILDEGHPVAFEFFGFLPKALEGRPEISHVPWRSSYQEYRRSLDELAWDAGLAPLRDLEFHRGKNNAKYREYAAAGIAGIYSDAEIYRSTVVHRETGLVVPHESEEAWYEAILELAGDAELRSRIRRNAFADLQANYRMADYVAKVAALLEGPLPRRRPGGSG